MNTEKHHHSFDIPHYLDALVDMIRSAGHMARDMYDKNEYAVFTKTDKSPVTEADQKVENFIEQQLQHITPTIPIVGEEGVSHAKDSGASIVDVTHAPLYWLVDPIDGTREFIERTGQYAISVALLEQGIPILGFIHAPSFDNALYVGGRGIGAWREQGTGDRQPLPLPNTIKDEFSIITSGRNYDADKVHKFLTKNVPIAHQRMGSALKFCILAENGAHFYPRLAPTMEWDTAAGDAILRAVGGGIISFDGTPLRYGKTDYRNGHFIAYAPSADMSILKI